MVESLLGTDGVISQCFPVNLKKFSLTNSVEYLPITSPKRIQHPVKHLRRSVL